MNYQYRPISFIETIVIGAGPTGLAASFLLKERGISHFVLERSDKVAASWHALWDNYQLAMPAKSVEMPGCDLGALFGDETHPRRDELIRFFNDYAREHRLPIRLNTHVIGVYKNEDGLFKVLTQDKCFICQHVICCIGPRNTPKIPHEAIPLQKHPSLRVIHSSAYRSTVHFEPSAKVLVIGSGASALSIAQDILIDGFSVSLACGYSPNEIQQRNRHLYDISGTVPVVPTLDKLVAMGVYNFGRFVGVMNEHMHFDNGFESLSVPLQRFTNIILATGFDHSYQALNDMFGIVSLSSSPGLYIAGIPKPDQQTVIISEGSRDAKHIVDVIEAALSLNKISITKPLKANL